MKPKAIPVLAALALFSFVGCGGGGESPSQGAAADAPEAAAPAEEAQVDLGERTDLDAFLTEYEEFVDQYCQFTEEFASANMTEMANLVEEMTTQGAKLAEFSTQAMAFQASASPEAQRRLEAMQTKAEGCAEKLSR